MENAACYYSIRKRQCSTFHSADSKYTINPETRAGSGIAARTADRTRRKRENETCHGSVSAMINLAGPTFEQGDKRAPLC